jgi:hypothetical protein
MSWSKGDLRTIELGWMTKGRGKQRREVVFTTFEIPAPYDRIVSQLLAESVHGGRDGGHESCRCQAYALEVLDAFGDELRKFKGMPVNFRSTVLTPILQRQLTGIHDAYTTTVRAGVNQMKKEPTLQGEPTIQDATALYLQVDPTDPIYIRSYRRNLLYLPEPRWHLGIVMNGFASSGQEAFNHINKFRANNDTIIQSIEVEGHKDVDQNLVPLLNNVEIRVIIDEGLEDFFQEELQRVVRDSPSFHCNFLTLIPTA